MGRERILLVEDESITRASLADVLQRQGYEVEEARDGIQALDIFARGHFDLVVTDLVMPRMDGFKLIAKVRSISPGIPVILVTAYLSQVSEEAILAQAAELIVKPIEPDNLLAAVRRILDRPNN